MSQQAEKSKQPAELDQQKLTQLVQNINESDKAFVMICPELGIKRYGETPHILINCENSVANGHIYVKRDFIRLLGHVLLKLTDRTEPRFGGK